jgi:hypothetical protein
MDRLRIYACLQKMFVWMIKKQHWNDVNTSFVVLVIVEKLTHKNTDTKSATETCLLIVQRELFPDLRVHKIQITATLCEMQLKRYRLCLITVITQDVRQIGNHVIYWHDFNGICFPQTHLSLPLSLRFS